MASYIPPTADLSTFNPAIFNQGDSEGITLQEADSRYFKKSGGFLTGGLGTPSISLDGVDLASTLETQEAAIALNTSKTGITQSQASAIEANTAKVGITTSQADAIEANTAKVGITTSQADAIEANTAKTGITISQAEAISTNTAKVGITTSQSDEITSFRETILSNGQVLISSNSAPHLMVERAAQNSGDAHVRIKGARTGGLQDTAQLWFQNYNSHSSVDSISSFGRIDGEKIGGSATNIGDLVFRTFSDGSDGSETEAMRMKSNNTIEITGPTTFAGNCTVGGSLKYIDTDGVLKDVETEINSKQDTLTIDASLSSTSSNPVQNQAVHTALGNKQALFEVGGTTRLTLDTSTSPNLLSVNSTNTVTLGDNKLVLGGGLFTYLLDNYNKKLTIGSTSTNQLEITSTSTSTNNINVNDILSVKLATEASQSDFGLVTGQLLDTEIGNINFPTYTAESGGGVAVNSSRQIGLDYGNMSNPNTIPRTTVISNATTPQLTVTQPSSSRDAVIVIEGQKTSNLGTPAQLKFQNINSNTGDSRHYFRIAGVETDNTNGIGGGVFYNFPLGTDAGKVGSLTMSNNGNFNMGNGLVFQDDYKLKINGVLDVTNIATLVQSDAKIVMGVTNALGAATTSNSYCYMQMKSVNISFGVRDGGTFKIDHGVDPDTGTAGTVSFTTSETETTISTNLNVAGTSRIDNISTNASTILLGNTNQDGASTVQNSHSWVELKTEKLAMAGPYVEIRHSSTATGATGTTGILVQADYTTIKNKVKIDLAGNISTNYSTEAALNIEEGILLLDGGTGRGYTKGSGVLQGNAGTSNKLRDCASFRSRFDNNNILNFCRDSDGQIRGRVDGDGAGNVKYRTSGDRRLKENVVDMDSCWDLVKEFKPRSYNWIEDKRNDVGFIAQEVYALDGFKTLKPVKDPTDPEKNKYYCCDEANMVFDEDGYCEEPIMEDGDIYPHALDYRNFTPYLWKALQEAIARIEELETKINNISN